MPVLSVVTPVWNSAAYLPYALDSVARLTVPHEHIVVDGGSTDGTVELLQNRNDPQLQWISEPDRGQTHAVNKGFARASGVLLAWLNGDDELISDAVDRAVSYLQQHDDVGAVFGGMHVLDEQGVVRRRYQPGRYSWRRYLIMGDYIPTPSIIFRRSLLDEVGLLDEQYVDAADYDFYLRVFERCRVARMPEALIRFRYHPESKTAKDVWLQQQEALRIRLERANGPLDKALMQGFDFTKRTVLPRISRWPKPYS
jgi:glycosyltransferase involved in cell wall biosynthesis